MERISDREALDKLALPDTAEHDRVFMEWYRFYAPAIRKFILKNGGSPADAEDIFQDALLVLYHKAREGRLVLSCSLFTFIYSISRNLWLKRLRQKGRETNLSDDFSHIPVDASQLAQLEANEELRLLSSLLDKLGESCRKVLMRYYFDRMSMKEIALDMGLSGEQVAKNKKSLCLKQLKELAKPFVG